MIDTLHIAVVENGFIVTDCDGRQQHVSGKQWVFETAEGLATFVRQWAQTLPKEKDNV